MSIQQILLPPILHPLPRRLLPGDSEYSLPSRMEAYSFGLGVVSHL